MEQHLQQARVQALVKEEQQQLTAAQTQGADDRFLLEHRLLNNFVPPLSLSLSLSLHSSLIFQIHSQVGSSQYVDEHLLAENGLLVSKDYLPSSPPLTQPPKSIYCTCTCLIIIYIIII